MRKRHPSLTAVERRELATERLAKRLLDIASRGLLLDYDDTESPGTCEQARKPPLASEVIDGPR